jgi:hypothetical protein
MRSTGAMSGRLGSQRKEGSRQDQKKEGKPMLHNEILILK